MDSQGQAVRKPRAVRAKEEIKNERAIGMRFIAPKEMPLKGAKTQKMEDCRRARVVPPRSLPVTIEAGWAGETRAYCRNPSRRSSMTVTVEKIAVKSMMRARVPEK